MCCRTCSTTPTSRSCTFAKDGRKGWAAAYRAATLIKTAYAYGLRRHEVRMLAVADLGTNPLGASSGSDRVHTQSTRPSALNQPQWQQVAS